MNLSEDDQQLAEEPATEGQDTGFVWDDDPAPAPEPTVEPAPVEPEPPPEDDPEILVEDPTPTPEPVFWDDEPTLVEPELTPTGTPTGTSIEEIITPPEVADDPFEFVAELSVTPTPLVSATPTPTVTPTPRPTVTPLVARPVTVTTSMVTNLHAGKEFYLNSLKSSYALTFVEDFGKIMDEIEYEYLAENHLIRPDGTRGVTDEAYLQSLKEQMQLQEAAKLAAKNAADNAARAVANASGGLVVLDMDGFSSDGATSDGLSSVGTGTVYPKANGVMPVGPSVDLLGGASTDATDDSVALADPMAGFTSGPEERFSDLVGPEGLLARNWQDVLAIYVYQQVKLGATQFALTRSSKQALSLIFRELNPITIVGSSASYANHHVGDYIREHNIPKWDRVVLKKYTETDCKLLCATVTAAKGFIRQSVGDNVSEERVNVIAAAFSLVGKVGYFWGGKSYNVGVDPRWGLAQMVTAEGSGTSGTLRAYGLDCSGFVTWAVINGYQNSGMRGYVGDGTSEQWNLARVVAENNAQPGDFVFQSGPEAGANNHVGILVGKTDSGDWIAVHCSSGHNGVTVGEAYSASFRYIREPSFYPLKTSMLVIGQENIDDILVPADLAPGSDLGFSDGTAATLQEYVEYVNEDFMDIVLFSNGGGANPGAAGAVYHEPAIPGLGDGMAAAAQGTVVLDQGGMPVMDSLGLAQQTAVQTAVPQVSLMDTGGLVVFDQGGPVQNPSSGDVLFMDEIPDLSGSVPPAEAALEDTSVPCAADGLVVLENLGEALPAEEEVVPAPDPAGIPANDTLVTIETLAEEPFAPGAEVTVLDLPGTEEVQEPRGVPPDLPQEDLTAWEDPEPAVADQGLVVLESLDGGMAPAPAEPVAAAPVQAAAPAPVAPAPEELVAFDLVPQIPAQTAYAVAPVQEAAPDMAVMKQLVVLEDFSADGTAGVVLEAPAVTGTLMQNVVTLDLTGVDTAPAAVAVKSAQAESKPGLLDRIFSFFSEGEVKAEVQTPALTVTPMAMRPVQEVNTLPPDAGSLVVLCQD